MYGRRAVAADRAVTICLNLPASPGDIDSMLTREQVVDVYECLLQRAPEGEHVIEPWLKSGKDVAALRREARASDEFFLKTTFPGLLHDLGREQLSFLRQFVSRDRRSLAGCVTDFVGSTTDCRFFRPITAKGGQVEDVPRPANFHSKYTSWLGALKAVAEAEDHIAIAEFGSGWGPWIVACGLAATKRGAKKLDLVAVEAVGGQIDFLCQHLVKNGFDPSLHRIYHGAIAATERYALMPPVLDPANDYHERPAFYDDRVSLEARLQKAPNFGAEIGQEVVVYTPSVVFGPLERIDLLHIDISGGELELLGSAIDALTPRVKRIIVATYGRADEFSLLDLFFLRGWQMEIDDPSRFRIVDGGVVLASKGVQVWRNPCLKSNSAAS